MIDEKAKRLRKMKQNLEAIQRASEIKPLGPDSTYPRPNRNMLDTQHTPTPWLVGRPIGLIGRDKEGDRLIFNEKTKEHVAEVFQYRNDNHNDKATSLANAQFIILACNYHDDLRMACENLLADVLNLGSFSITNRPSTKTARNILTAIKKEAQ